MPLRLVSRLTLLLSLAGALSGCAASDTGPTRGWSAEVRRAHPATRQFTYFELRRDGELIYIAGLGATSSDIASARPTWRGRLTAAEAAGLADVLDGWSAAAPTSPEPDGLVYRLRARRAGELARTMETGPSDFADRLYAALDRAQRTRRFETAPR